MWCIADWKSRRTQETKDRTEGETNLKGTFVNGMTAMKTTIRIERGFGYPLCKRMLLVISSRVPSPNINTPTIAMVTSSRKVYVYVCLSARVYLTGCRISR